MVEITDTARRNAFIGVIIGVLMVMVPLGITGSRITEDALTEGVTRVVANDWAAGTDYEVQRVDANRGDVSILIAGHGT